MESKLGMCQSTQGGINMFAINTSATMVGNLYAVGKNSAQSQKPVWNPNKVYQYLEDMNKGFQDYKAQATAYYRSEIAKSENSTMTTEELKKQINELFPEYTLTNTEPSKVTQGKFYLYIDASNLEKMAKDADYRARVYGLMDSELQGSKGYTLQYSDGRNVTAHLTGSIFSLSDANKKYDCGDGIPYHGSCTSDQSFSSSESHPQVRNMSFIYDNIDPVKSAAKARNSLASQNAARLAKNQEKKAASKAAEKKAASKKTAEKKAASKAAEKKAASKAAEKKAAQKKAASKEDVVKKYSDEAFGKAQAQEVPKPSEQYGNLGRQTVGILFDINA